MLSPEFIRSEFETTSALLSRIEKRNDKYGIHPEMLDSLSAYWQVLAVIMEIPPHVLIGCKPEHVNNQRLEDLIELMDAEDAQGSESQ